MVTRKPDELVEKGGTVHLAHPLAEFAFCGRPTKFMTLRRKYHPLIKCEQCFEEDQDDAFPGPTTGAARYATVVLPT